ncbi:unnamed protein product, partial [marine sediment metagenome]
MHGSLIGARIAVETCMSVKSGERVLIVTDPPRRKIAEALLEAVRIVGGKTMLICMPTGTKHGEEPPKLVADAMRTADIVFAPTTYSLTHPQSYRHFMDENLFHHINIKIENTHVPNALTD